MPAEFKRAPEVEEIARQLIRECADHQHLVEARILYLFRYGAWPKGGDTVLGKAQRLTGLNGYLAKQMLLRAIDVTDRDAAFDFVIMINGDRWEYLSPGHRAALVDHELCHCIKSGDDDEGRPIWAIANHDVEEFASVVRRHGIHDERLRGFAKVLKQVSIEAQATLDDYQTGGQVATGPLVQADASEPGTPSDQLMDRARAIDDEDLAEAVAADEDELAAGPLYRRYYCLKCRKRVEAREVVTFEQGKPIHRRDDGTECDDPVFVALPGEPDPDLEALAGAMDHARAAS